MAINQEDLKLFQSLIANASLLTDTVQNLEVINAKRDVQESVYGYSFPSPSPPTMQLSLLPSLPLSLTSPPLFLSPSVEVDRIYNSTSATDNEHLEKQRIRNDVGSPKCLPQFPPIKPLPPFEFDMKHTTRHIINKLSKIADRFKEDLNSYELESRLIVKFPSSHKVSTDIPPDMFDEILNYFLINSLAGHYKFTPWFYTMDIFYPGDIRQRNTWSLSRGATSNTINQGLRNISTGEVEVIKTCCEKKLDENSDWYIDGRPLSMRVSLKKEKKISPLMSTTNVMTSIQIKQTCILQDKTVTIYFSFVWHGDTEYEARYSIPNRMIEVEINNSAVTPTTRSDSIIYNLVARTLELQGLNAPLALSEVR